MTAIGFPPLVSLSWLGPYFLTTRTPESRSYRQGKGGTDQSEERGVELSIRTSQGRKKKKTGTASRQIQVNQGAFERQTAEKL